MHPYLALGGDSQANSPALQAGFYLLFSHECCEVSLACNADAHLKKNRFSCTHCKSSSQKLTMSYIFFGLDSVFDCFVLDHQHCAGYLASNGGVLLTC